MLISIGTQFNVIIYNILAGMLTGILFDLYRLIRGFENPDRIITLIEDILFWTFTGLVVFIFLSYTGYIYMSINLYIYIALGIIIYLKLISKYFLKMQYKIIKSLSRTIRIIGRLLIYPLELMFFKIVKKNK